ncbi:MAG TPA: glycosyltransferase [Gammaproteobacteria bacterium]|nr:glycosyltransferase [Gammaproteobacteria bacterium]
MSFLLAAIGGLLSLFVLYQLVLALFSLGGRRGMRAPLQGEALTRFAVVIPAHNEEQLIEGLIRSIQAADYPADHVDIHVIADNCSDDTADIAREAGAICHERDMPDLPGKPYALDWLFQRLEHSRYDAYTIIDADTVIDAGYLRAMDRSVREGRQAIQGYFGVMNPDENWLTRLSILPGILRYVMQCPGKERLGLSCPLAGNGMCFHVDIIRRLGWNAYSIAENWEYYAILTFEGVCVFHEPGAIIYSQVANSLKEGRVQRMRWMRGRIDTLKRYAPRLLRETLRKRDFRYADVVMELLRPSHSMLFLAVCGWLLLVSVGVAWFGLSVGWLYWALGLFLAQVAFFMSGLFIQRAPLKTWLALAWVPVYLVWKLLVSARSLLSLSDRRWVKTRRN